jgi:hypothetical protein
MAPGIESTKATGGRPLSSLLSLRAQEFAWPSACNLSVPPPDLATPRLAGSRFRFETKTAEEGAIGRNRVGAAEGGGGGEERGSLFFSFCGERPGAKLLRGLKSEGYFFL